MNWHRNKMISLTEGGIAYAIWTQKGRNRMEVLSGIEPDEKELEPLMRGLLAKIRQLSTNCDNVLLCTMHNRKLLRQLAKNGDIQTLTGKVGK